MTIRTKSDENNSESAREIDSGPSRWYRQVAKVTLAAGTAAVGASATDASGSIVNHTVNAPVAAGANHDGSPTGEQQMLFFDLVTGTTFAGPVGASSVGLSTMDANPQVNFRFGLIRVGPAWVGLYGRAANDLLPAVNNQVMGTGAPVTWWPVAPSGTWQQANYVRPFQLAANAVIGPGGPFYSAPPRTWEGAGIGSGVNVQTMAAPWGDGVWSAGSDGYLGLKFSPTNDGTNFNYGWAHVSIDSNFNMTLLSVGYETELNTPILAGQLEAESVPEPPAMSLLLLGAAGLATFRAVQSRRKKKQQQEGTDNASASAV